MVTDWAVEELAMGCPALRQLNVNSTNITDEALQELMRGCSDLQMVCVETIPARVIQSSQLVL